LNIFKTSREWIPLRRHGFFPGEKQYIWDTKENIEKDELGWVKSLNFG
jgi:hypothetical protein